jgi:hypothetical protein
MQRHSPRQQLPDIFSTHNGQFLCQKLPDKMKTERDKYAESFADYVIEAMARQGKRQADLVRATGQSRQTISQIVGKKLHSLTGKLLLPERETVDKIANALDDSVASARKAAGYYEETQTRAAIPTTTAADRSPITDEMLLSLIKALPLDQKASLFTILQAIHAGGMNAPPSDPKELIGKKIKLIGVGESNDKN